MEGEGEQYEIFKGDGYSNRIKVHKDLGIYEWWLRSPKANSSNSFCIVHSTGHAGYTSASWPYAGVNFGLCV